MTLEEAIEEANSRSTNFNLNYYVHKWNDGYAIAPTSYVKKFPNIEYVYSTGGDLDKEWIFGYDKVTNKRKHMISLIKK